METTNLHKIVNDAIRDKRLIRYNNIQTLLITMEELNKINIEVSSEIQRVIIDDKIEKIVEYQEDYFKTNKRFNFLGSLNINHCKEDNKNYLMDGQHRYRAMLQLFGKKYNEKIKIELITVEKFDDMKENFDIINKNTQLPEFSKNIDKQVPENAFRKIKDRFPKVFKTTKRATRPHINQNDFQEALGFLTEKLNEKLGENIDSDKLRDLILEKNSEMKNWPVEAYEKTIRNGVKWEKYINEASKHGFYLGLYNKTSQEYTFEWVRDIIKEKCGIQLKKTAKKRKKTIPKQIKDQVWSQYIGEDIAISYCFCCREEKIKMNGEYECGHVEAESKGGPTDVSNLRPICKKCNRSMGTINMYEYVQKTYPKKSTPFKNSVSPGKWKEKPKKTTSFLSSLNPF